MVVEAGGAWTSVSPGSQQYWLQAFNNVMYGRWEKIESGYGRAVLGYFGKTPLPPDEDVIKKASEQLDKPVFDGDPLEAAPKNIAPAKKALEDLNIETTDKNIFLVLAAMVPGKKVELNEGIRLLTGKSKIDIPLKKKEKPAVTEKAAIPASLVGPVQSRCVVEENGKSRTFMITLEPVHGKGEETPTGDVVDSAQSGEAVYSTFAGTVDIVDILVKVGDTVSKGQVIAHVEAMKAQHDIKAQRDGKVTSISVKIGDEIDSTRPILTLS